MRRAVWMIAALVFCLAGYALAEADKETVSVPPEAAAAPDTGTAKNGTEIFDALNSLKYHPYTCDGLPEYRLAAADGTVYWMNFSGKWVWRKGCGQTELSEAGLSDELIAQCKENANLIPTEYADIEMRLDPDDP